ncbi:MAG: Ig-like domain-containing protein [Bacteroidaceae bacterium]|nr:Ig-like domain-containing protein [Bacteroidaceae bacterium]
MNRYMSLKEILLSLLVVAMLAACASMGTPDGGPFDEDPPVFVGGIPAPNATGVTDGKVVLEFDENIKLENAFEKVVISPPQFEQPQIKYSGKRITVQLYDSLIPNTTYSIDFNDAVVDNNEGNPLENFAYVFSTGTSVDTLAVSGTVLNAEDLEPIKGIMVGLHSLMSDTAFTKLPFERVARTDSRGRFSIKGLAPGKYRLYALADANGNYLYDQKSETLAFLETVVSPSAIRAMRNDTIWRDSITVDTVRAVEYTRNLPDDIVLRAFKEPFYTQYLMKYPRDEHSNFTMYFAAPNSELPKVKGLNFDDTDAYVLEANATMDTLRYWFKDTTVYYKDTLELAVTYNVLDSLQQPVPRTDTLYISSKRSREAVIKAEAEKFAKEEKRFLKRASKLPDYDENNPPAYVPPTKELIVLSTAKSQMDFNREVEFSFIEPLSSYDASMIHLSSVVDSTFTPIPFVFEQSRKNIRTYNLYAEWRPGETYMLTIDSAAFKGLYGGVSKMFEQKMTYRTLDDYAVLYLTIPHTGNDAVVELVSGEKVVNKVRTENNKCAFYFINPGKYSLRLFMDKNGNNKWDTGSYEDKLQPEEVYYYPHMLDLRALFEYEQDDWDIKAPLNTQKPLEITKQKPDKEKKKMNRNATRKFK